MQDKKELKKKAKETPTKEKIARRLEAKAAQEHNAKATKDLEALEVTFRGRVYPALRRGDEFVGFVGKMPRGIGTAAMRGAIAEAMS